MDYETPQFFRVMQYAKQANRDVVDMVSGSPDWEPPSALREGLAAYAEADPDEFQYPPSVGLTELREEIADRRGLDREQIVITNGAGEANHLAMAGGLELFSGEEVLLTDPVYPYYAGRANFLEAEPRFAPVGPDGRLDPETVREHAGPETAVIVINSPNNPLGVTYPEETIADLVEIAEAADALLISDEVYDHFDYSGQFTSALSVDSTHRVVTNSFSKSMAITGFRVGYVVFPDAESDLQENARTRHMLSTVTGSRPAQAAVLHALNETDPSYYEDVRARLRARIDRFTDALATAGAEYVEPEGAFYVMARFPGFPGSFENVERLIDEAGVAGMPGEAFGREYEEWIRFALVTPRVETAADRLAGYFDEIKGRNQT
jgi:Aspartate/tyrosine/aromatic aminotransferase